MDDGFRIEGGVSSWMMDSKEKRDISMDDGFKIEWTYHHG